MYGGKQPPIQNKLYDLAAYIQKSPSLSKEGWGWIVYMCGGKQPPLQAKLCDLDYIYKKKAKSHRLGLKRRLPTLPPK